MDHETPTAGSQPRPTDGDRPQGPVACAARLSQVPRGTDDERRKTRPHPSPAPANKRSVASIALAVLGFAATLGIGFYAGQ